MQTDQTTVRRKGSAPVCELPIQRATETQPALAKWKVSPHTIRHTTAMHILQSGVDISVIALWLGHESPVWEDRFKYWNDSNIDGFSKLQHKLAHGES